LKDKPRVYFDSNVLIYALGRISKRDMVEGNPTASVVRKIAIANELLFSTQSETRLASVLNLNETANTLLKRYGENIESIKKTHALILENLDEEIIPIDMQTIRKTYTLEKENFSWYDKMHIASALEAKAQVLYTEDMQEKRIGNLWIVNPFS